MERNASPPAGFTIAETLVAIVLITLVLGALEGNAAGTLQQLRDENSESLAARMVQRRAEIVLAGRCADSPSNGVDSSGAVVVTWQATAVGSIVQIDQTVRYATHFGPHTDAFRAAGVCQ